VAPLALQNSPIVVRNLAQAKPISSPAYITHYIVDTLVLVHGLYRTSLLWDGSPPISQATDALFSRYRLLVALCRPDPPPQQPSTGILHPSPCRTPAGAATSRALGHAPRNCSVGLGWLRSCTCRHAEHRAPAQESTMWIDICSYLLPQNVTWQSP